jgi:hypothetical protein
MDTEMRNGGQKLSSDQERLANISPDGDVILVVGLENARLRVSSYFLRSASKIFSAMLRTDWSDGQGLSKESPAKIALPEDNAEAMRTVCRCIHYQYDLVSVTLTTEEVLQIAIEVDKYDLKNAIIEYIILEWLKPQIGVTMVATGHLLAAAFLLDSLQMFVEHSKTLLLHYSVSYLGLMKDDLIVKILLADICCM